MKQVGMYKIRNEMNMCLEMYYLDSKSALTWIIHGSSLPQMRGTGYAAVKYGDVPQSTILFILEIGCLYQYFFLIK